MASKLMVRTVSLKLVAFGAGFPSSRLVSVSPRQTENILGGASLCPKRTSFPGLAMEAI